MIMAWLVGSLLDSQLVARFQRSCGLFPAAAGAAGEDREGRALGTGDGSDGHLPAARDLCNGGGGGGGGGGSGSNSSSVKYRQQQHLACNGPNPSVKDYSQQYVIKNYFYYYLFRISAAMGQEVFYITFLPFSYWSINPYIARRLIIMWCVVMYIGQVSKDLLKWPRPLSPPVVKLETKTNAEYGMPSTHAMAATAISFTFVIASVNQYKFSFALGLLGAFSFSTLVGLSRIYTGMHTVLDVIVGSLISALLIALAYPTWDLIDHLMLTSPLCPPFCLTVPLLLCYNYPKLDYYSPTRADTTTILGATAGAIIGAWIHNCYIVTSPAEGVTHVTPSDASDMFVMVLAKFSVGIFMLLVTRQIVKSVAVKALCSWYKVSADDVEAMQQVKIEVPCKFVTYISIGLSATVLVPLLHDFFRLN